ncbi:MAG: hypothetical protein JWM74_5197, partial [Myxococcaceae bacterium]|nr:hypothetical protein [Myxococcaceae bacterium]
LRTDVVTDRAKFTSDSCLEYRLSSGTMKDRMQHCPHCRARVLLGRPLCTGCGRPVPRASSSGSGWIWIALGAPVVLVLAGVAGALLMRLRGSHASGFDVECTEAQCPPVGPIQPAHVSFKTTDPTIDRVRFDIPLGALTESVMLRVERSPEPLNLLVASSAKPSFPLGPTFRFGPDGQTFGKPIAVQVPYSPQKLKKMKPTATVRVVSTTHVDGVLKTETIVPTKVDATAGLVTFETTHFSDVIVVGSDPTIMIMSGTDSTIDTGMAGSTSTSTTAVAPTISPLCREFMSSVERARCQGGKFLVEWDDDAFWEAIGLGKELEGVFDHKCPYYAAGLTNWTYRKCRLATYLDTEDGGHFGSAGQDVPIKPLRSGKETALYELLKQHIASNPTAPVSPEKMFELALVAVKTGGKANVPLALLTALNVVRVLARPGQWAGHIMRTVKGELQPCPPDMPNCGMALDDPEWGHAPDDSMYPILQDLIGVKATGEGDTLPALLAGQGRIKMVHGKVSPTWSMELYGSDGPSTFQSLSGTGNGKTNSELNGGSHYYFWTGALGEAELGHELTMYGLRKEKKVKDEPGLAQNGQGKLQTGHGERGLNMTVCLRNLASDGFLRTSCDPSKWPAIGGPKAKPKPVPTATTKPDAGARKGSY